MKRRLIVEWSGDRVQVERTAVKPDEAMGVVLLMLTGADQIRLRNEPACATGHGEAVTTGKAA